MDTKVCTSPDCHYQGKPQPIENFHRNSYGKDGYNSICKECKRRHARIRYHESEEIRQHKAQYVNKYRQTEHGKAIFIKSFCNFQEKYPNKIKATQAVHSKIQNKKLIHPSKLVCAKCGNQAQEYHHYKGYEKEHWLDVIPLCSDCHDLIHRKPN